MVYRTFFDILKCLDPVCGIDGNIFLQQTIEDALDITDKRDRRSEVFADLGGIDIVKDRIDKLGITNYNLTETEETMHSRISNCYNNWSTPSSTLQLLEKLYNEPILNETHTEFLKNILT